MFLNGIHHLSDTALWPRAELNPHSRAGPFFRRRLRSHTRMDPDLENVIRQALEDAQVAGKDHLSHTEATELHTSIEEPEDMNTSDRGLKHVCPECATKYYDLRKEVVACPRCGAKPLAAIDSKATQSARKTGRTTSRWYR